MINLPHINDSKSCNEKHPQTQITPIHSFEYIGKKYKMKTSHNLMNKIYGINVMSSI